MRIIPRLAWTLAVASIGLALGCAAPPAPEEEVAEEEMAMDEPASVALFDGETFDGWEGNMDLFRIEDGAIVGGHLSEDIAQSEYLCTTGEYADFELHLQARSSREDANGGVQFRSRRTPGEADVVGFQADLGLLGRDDPPQNIWGALYDQSRRNELLAVPDQEGLAEVFRPGEWNDYVVRAQGPHIQIWVNGFQTVDYTEEDPEIEDTGLICLQVHRGAPSEVSYRNFEIETLDAASSEDDSAED